MNPSEIQTNMTFNKELDIMTITPKQCVAWALKDLGKETLSDGHWNHKL